MNWDDIVSLLEQGEGQSVEFEKSVPPPDDIAREIVAFANADGGKIIYGIDDKNKHLVGAEVTENLISSIQNIAKNSIIPSVNVEVEVIEKAEKHIVVISIPNGDDKPYRVDEICYIRDDKESRPTKDNEEEEITNPWSGKGLNKRQIRAIQIMNERGEMTNRDYREAFGVSHKTAHIEMTLLVDKHLAVSDGAGRSTRYILVKQPEE